MRKRFIASSEPAPCRALRSEISGGFEKADLEEHLKGCYKESSLDEEPLFAADLKEIRRGLAEIFAVATLSLGRLTVGSGPRELSNPLLPPG